MGSIYLRIEAVPYDPAMNYDSVNREERSMSFRQAVNNGTTIAASPQEALQSPAHNTSQLLFANLYTQDERIYR